MRDGLVRLACAITRVAYASRHDALAAHLTVETSRDIVECHILRTCANKLCAIVLVRASLFEGQGGKTPTHLRQELIQFVHALYSITFLLDLSSIISIDNNGHHTNGPSEYNSNQIHPHL